MMDHILQNGVYPTMVTPFTKDNKIDYDVLLKLIKWYENKGVHGLFAVCKSSEMFDLTLEERITLARFVKNHSKLPVIASGHISDGLEDQIREINEISETGIDGFVLVTNRLANQEEPDSKWQKNMEKLLANISPTVPLGLYECPQPYKRLLSPELLKWCANTGRFYFLKDTSCDVENMKAKVEAIKGTQLKIFNANAATLYSSLKIGVSGYTGVMANFHPHLYVQGMASYQNNPKVVKLFDFLGIASIIERQFYPVNAKYYFQLEGLPISLLSRCQEEKEFSSAMRLKVEQLQRITHHFEQFISDRL